CRARSLRRSIAWVRPSLLGKFDPHLAVALRIVAPALAHLDEQEQVNRLLDGGGDLPPRVGADGLDGGASLAEDDLALALALDVDRLLNSHRAVAQLLPDIGF